MTPAASNIGAPVRTVAGPPARLTPEEWLLAGVCGYFLVLRAVYAATAFPIADEAYYWMWGLHPQLSYFDHPPLQGWIEGLFHAAFGRSILALRLPSLLTLIGDGFVLYFFARRIGGAGWRRLFLATLTIFLASPLFGWFGGVVFLEYLLVFLLLAASALFLRYFADVEERGAGRLQDLLCGAALLGLAGLTKYNGVYLGLAIGAVVLVRPRLRVLLRRWPIYAAALIAIGFQLPVLIWNVQHDFASFRFRVSDPLGGGGTFTGLDIGALKAFATDQATLLSPFLVPVIARFFWARPDLPFLRVGKAMALWAFWLSTLTFLYIVNYSWVLWWWNIAAYVLVLPFAGRYMGRVLLGLHVIWGLCVGTFLSVNYAIMPLSLNGAMIQQTETLYGWEAIASAVREAEARYRPAFVAATSYQAASQLAFALDDPDVTAISSRTDAYDFWFDPAAHEGESALLLVDPAGDVETYRAAFASLEQVGSVATSYDGRVLKTYPLYLGEGYGLD
jgi:hypothetical protein